MCCAASASRMRCIIHPLPYGVCIFPKGQGLKAVQTPGGRYTCTTEAEADHDGTFYNSLDDVKMSDVHCSICGEDIERVYKHEFTPLHVVRWINVTWSQAYLVENVQGRLSYRCTICKDKCVNASLDEVDPSQFAEHCQGEEHCLQLLETLRTSGGRNTTSPATETGLPSPLAMLSQHLESVAAHNKEQTKQRNQRKREKDAKSGKCLWGAEGRWPYAWRREGKYTILRPLVCCYYSRKMCTLEDACPFKHTSSDTLYVNPPHSCGGCKAHAADLMSGWQVEAPGYRLHLIPPKDVRRLCVPKEVEGPCVLDYCTQYMDGEESFSEVWEVNDARELYLLPKVDGQSDEETKTEKVDAESF